MRNMPMFLPIMLFATACSGTGQPEVTYSAFTTPNASGDIAVGDWQVTLDEAALAFGPVYFCAAASGSATLCETAVAEITQVTAFDALATEPQPLGEVRGFEGEIRSASFDYGIHWFLTEPSPVVDAAAVHGHSLHLAGRATRGDQIVHFVADVDAIAQFQGQRAVPSAAASASVHGSDARLDVRFDIASWIGGIDFDAAAEAGSAEPFVIEPGTSDYNGIVIAMVATFPPELVWSGASVKSAE